MADIIIRLALIAIVLLILYIIGNIYSLYSKLKQYPNGVFPLPVIGSLLPLLLNMNRNPIYYFNGLAQRFGGYFTFWMGSQPVIMVTDCEIAKSLLNRTEFSDRTGESLLNSISDLIVDKNFSILNYDEEFKVLRKISIEVLRKYLLVDNLYTNVHEIANETVEIMLKKECGKQFIPFHYINSIVVRSLIRTSFGELVAFDSPVIQQILDTFDIIQESLLKILSSDSIPILKLFHNKSAQNSVTYATNKLMRNWYRNSLKSYYNESTESLSHLLYSAKLRFLSENQKYEKYVNESNLIGVLITLFFAGSDTTHYTFKWMLLLMCYYPEMQQKMRDEIKNNIGDKRPETSDKEKCDFVNAFIAETLRFRNITPLGVFHRTLCDTNIGNKKIPKGVQIYFNQFFMLNDPKYWTNPQQFNPQRFINSNGCFDKTNLFAFIPFSTGKRMCIGDRFAMNTLFVSITCLLQATDGYFISLVNKQISSLEPKTFGFLLEPKPYKIVIIKD